MAESAALDELLERARSSLAVGRLDEAEAACLAAAALAGDAAQELLFLRGAVALERGAARTALPLLAEAAARDAECARSASALGHAQLACGETADAVTSYRRAIALEPRSADRHADLSVALRAIGERASAEAACRRALELDAAHPAALNQWGILCEDRERLGDAAEAFRAALRSARDVPLLHANLARVLLALGAHAESARHYARALEQVPDRVAWLNARACALRASGDTAQARALLERAHALEPASLVVRRNLICLRFESGELARALELCERAHAEAPEDDALCALLVPLRAHVCVWGDAALHAALDRANASALRERRRAPETPLDHVARCADPARNRDVARSWAQALRVEATLPSVAPDERRGEARIRLGYCGGDFREHPIAHLIARVLERHDRARFEVSVFSYGPSDASAIRARIAAGCDHFVDLSALSHADAAARIRAQRIDVLVELSTHTQYGRLEISAQRPAPIQIAYLGFPGTVGAPWLDYTIGDRCVIPAEQRAHYDEAIVFLPRCYQASDAQQAVDPDTPDRTALGLPESACVLAAFHRAAKLDAEVFALWMRILARSPASVLWLLGSDTLAATLRRQAGQHGVEPERLIFAPALRRERHLARLRQVDLALDTLRYNGHTTTSDALWMGAPVIALEGRHFASRVSASILRSAHLSELATSSLSAYEERAVELANDAGARAALRRRLAAARSSAPYFEPDGCVRDLERAYRSVWQRFLEGLPAADLELPDASAPTCTEIATRLSP
jgi:protein O-GlcNAc transferase